MQKINKNNEGVTLIALAITVIVLAILLGVTLQYGLTETNSVKNKKMESELSIVQEAVMQRYALVKSQHELGKHATAITENIALADDVGRPEGFIGIRLANCDLIFNNGFADVTPINGYFEGDINKTYEEYYYWLDESDLEAIGIKKGRESSRQRVYIVNYLTGEIFDIANRKYYVTRTQNDDPIYTQPGIIKDEGKKYEFNDN